jgi:hypothetical protein
LSSQRDASLTELSLLQVLSLLPLDPNRTIGTNFLNDKIDRFASEVKNIKHASTRANKEKINKVMSSAYQ